MVVINNQPISSPADGTSTLKDCFVLIDGKTELALDVTPTRVGLCFVWIFAPPNRLLSSLQFGVECRLPFLVAVPTMRLQPVGPVRALRKRRHWQLALALPAPFDAC